MSTIGCDEFRRFTDPYMDGEFDESERAMFDAHQASCAECRRYFEQQSWMLREIKPLLKQPYQLSSDARERLNRRMRVAQRPEQARTIVKRLAHPVPALLLVGAALVLILPLAGFNSSVVINDLVKLHRNDLQVEVPTANRAEVNQWLTAKLPGATTPLFRDQRVSLLGARFTRVNTGGSEATVPAAKLLYRVGEHKMSVLVFNERGTMDLDQDALKVRGHTVQLHDTQNHRVALFRHGGHTYAVTSDLPAEEIVEVIGTSL